MFEKLDIKKFSAVFPYLIYRRVVLTGPGILLFPIDMGYWFWFRDMRAQSPEIDVAGVTFNEGLSFELIGSAVHRVYQDVPIPLRLVSTPASDGIQAFAGGQFTAASVSSTKKLNYMIPNRDNIQIRVTGQDATPFPATMDIVLCGYLIPDNAGIEWKGSNDA